MTKQRQLVLDIITAAPRHMSAEEIYVHARQKMPSIARATIYNTLNYLSERGIIRRLALTGDTDRYDRSPLPHAHLLCDSCGHITDLLSDSLPRQLSALTDARVLSFDLTLHILCPACRDRQKS